MARPSISEQLDALGRPGPDWDRFGLSPISQTTLGLAVDLARSLPEDLLEGARVVPMTRGRLQFELSQGGRELELEVEPVAIVHYLMWCPAEGVAEEDFVPASDIGRLCALLHWVAGD